MLNWILSHEAGFMGALCSLFLFMFFLWISSVENRIRNSNMHHRTTRFQISGLRDDIEAVEKYLEKTPTGHHPIYSLRKLPPS